MLLLCINEPRKASRRLAISWGRWRVQLRFLEQNLLKTRSTMKSLFIPIPGFWAPLESCIWGISLLPHKNRNIPAWLLDTQKSSWCSDYAVWSQTFSCVLILNPEKDTEHCIPLVSAAELRKQEYVGSGSLTHPINETLTSQRWLLWRPCRSSNFGSLTILFPQLLPSSPFTQGPHY